MRLTPRDINLFKWINGFGWVYNRHIARWMNVVYQTANDRVVKLKQHGLLRASQIAFGSSHLITLTPQSWTLTQDTLPLVNPCKNLSLVNHNAQLIDLSLELTKRFNESMFLPERRIKREFPQDLHHLPDGALFLTKDQTAPIAIELELTRKKLSRLRHILRSYQSGLTYSQVWYFAPSSILQTLTPLVENDPLFQLFLFEEGQCKHIQI